MRFNNALHRLDSLLPRSIAGWMVLQLKIALSLVVLVAFVRATMWSGLFGAITGAVIALPFVGIILLLGKRETLPLIRSATLRSLALRREG